MEQIGQITHKDYKFSNSFSYVFMPDHTRILSHFYVRHNSSSNQYCLLDIKCKGRLTKKKIEAINNNLKNIIKLENGCYKNEITIDLMEHVSRKKFNEKKKEKLAELLAKLPKSIEYKSLMVKCFDQHSSGDWQSKAKITRSREMNDLMRDNRASFENRPLFLNTKTPRAT